MKKRDPVIIKFDPGCRTGQIKTRTGSQTSDSQSSALDDMNWTIGWNISKKVNRSRAKIKILFGWKIKWTNTYKSASDLAIVAVKKIRAVALHVWSLDWQREHRWASGLKCRRTSCTAPDPLNQKLGNGAQEAGAALQTVFPPAL